MNRQIQRLLRSVLRQSSREALRAARRGRPRRAEVPVLVSVLVVGAFGVLKYLEEPQAPPPPTGAELACRVVEVVDGDTVEASCPAGRLRVRVWGIDAPEMGQGAWGERARGALSRLADPPEIRLQVVDTDRYGRTVGRLFRGEQDLGLALVRDGQAAVYRHFNDSDVYRDVERLARREGAGIWAEDGAQQTPWEWRRLNPR